MYDTYKDRGFTVLAFPCAQFGGQEFQKDKDIKEFVHSKFGSQFPLFSKIDVKGPNEHPVFTALKAAFPGDIGWNFAGKWLVNRDGVPIQRFGTMSRWKTIEKAVEEELSKGE